MNKKLNFITRTLLLCLMFYMSSTNALTQNIKHKCEIGIFDFNKFDFGKDDKPKIEKLGSFFIDVKGSNLTTKFYKLPVTKVTIGALVSYSGELKLPRYLNMVLVLGKKRFVDNGFVDLLYAKTLKNNVFSTALARFPLKSFERGEVLTYFPGKGKYSITVHLECEK